MATTTTTTVRTPSPAVDSRRHSLVSSAASFDYETAPSASSSTSTVNATSPPVQVNPLHTLSKEGREVHVVKVAGDRVDLKEGVAPAPLITKLASHVDGHHVGPPPPSPPASIGDEEPSILIVASPSSMSPEPRPRSSPSETPKPPQRSNTFQVGTLGTLDLKSSPKRPTERKVSISSTIHPRNVESIDQTPSRSNTSNTSTISADGFLQPPPVTVRAPTRRNTTGSAPFAKPPRLAHAHSASHETPLDLDPDILQQAERIRRERQTKRAKAQQEKEEALSRKEEEKREKVAVGNLIGEDHVNYVLMYNMLTGIRIAVSRCQAKMTRQITDEDYTACHKYSFDIVGNELTPSAKYDFKFKDYAPWVFRELREEYFQIEPADYLVSLTAKYILSELGSPGKSGSFFYFSRDYRFIIKTIHHAEHKFFRKVLKQYHQHVKSNPHTLISRFYGLHRVKLPRGKKIHFVIMNNLFPPHRDIHETYDLKGSTVGREYPEAKAEKNPRAVLKDLNWLDRHRTLELGPEKKALLQEQLRRDTEFLKSINVMDYSLLIGIHNLARGNRDNLRSNTLRLFSPDVHLHSKGKRRAAVLRGATASKAEISLPNEESGERSLFVFYQDEGGYRATDLQNENTNTIYYFGVIDIFTPYTVAKRAEHIWKGMSADRHKISPVPAIEYGDRFIAFLSAVMTGGEGGQRFRE